MCGGVGRSMVTEAVKEHDAQRTRQSNSPRPGRIPLIPPEPPRYHQESTLPVANRSIAAGPGCRCDRPALFRALKQDCGAAVDL